MAQSYLFVTVGTTKFEKLVDHVCSYPFLKATFDSGVKAVVCQTGNGRLPAEVAAVARRPASSRAGGAGRGREGSEEPSKPASSSTRTKTTRSVQLAKTTDPLFEDWVAVGDICGAEDSSPSPTSSPTPASSSSGSSSATAAGEVLIYEVTIAGFANTTKTVASEEATASTRTSSSSSQRRRRKATLRHDGGVQLKIEVASHPAVELEALLPGALFRSREHQGGALRAAVESPTCQHVHEAAAGDEDQLTIYFCRFFPQCYEALVVNATAVLSHAGAGSILTALRWGKRLCVVVNDDLMGNHQLELAQAMAEGGYLWMVEGLREVVDDVADVQEFHREDEEEQDKMIDDEAVEDVEVDDVLGFIEDTEPQSSEVLQWSLPAQIRRTLKGAVEDDPRTRMKQYPKADRTGFHRLIAQEVGLIGFAPAGAPSSIQHESRRCSVM